MAKLPYMQFFPGDYIKDTRLLSLQARGAWMDLLCLMWDANPRGKVTNTIPSFARLFGCDEPMAKSILDELILTNICDSETLCNGNVTLINRRMARDEKVRELGRCRVQRFRNAKVTPDGNAKVTPYIPESIFQKPESIKKTTIAVTYNFDSHSWENVNGQMDVWVKAFPAVDIRAQLDLMASWLEANPKNRKSNYTRFIHNWLTRAQDKAPTANQVMQSSGNSLRYDAQKCQSKSHGTCAASWSTHKDKPTSMCHWCSKFDHIRGAQV